MTEKKALVVAFGQNKEERKEEEEEREGGSGSGWCLGSMSYPRH